jgi:hypothetical protein
MTTFDRREEGFENQFAYDEELRFKAEARRNKLLGLWAAEKLKLSGPAADDYARGVVDAAVAAAGDRAVVSKLAGDLTAKGAGIPEGAIREKMAELLEIATAQIKAGQ